MIMSIINSAFRLAEEFFVAGDRIDLGSVLNFLGSGTFLLAQREGKLLGCVYVEPSRIDSSRSSPHPSAHAYLGLLSVAPAAQQSGLGSVLMNAAEDHCRGLGMEFMDIIVVNLREELFGFYRRRGYVETGCSPFPEDVATKLPCHFIDMSKPLNNDIAP